MKKDISKDAPTNEEQPSSTRKYFTKEINEKIAAMGAKEMESVMKEFVDTQYWIAMVKYTNMRMPLLDATLRGTDPIKDPSKISWAQGAMAGICDVENYVIELNNPENAKKEPGAEEGGTIIG